MQNVELFFGVSVGGHILRRKIKHRMHLGRKIDIKISKVVLVEFVALVFQCSVPLNTTKIEVELDVL